MQKQNSITIKKILSLWQVSTIAYSLIGIYLHDLKVIYEIMGIYFQNSIFFLILFLPFLLLATNRKTCKIGLILTYPLSLGVSVFHIFNTVFFKRYGSSLTNPDIEILFQSNLKESIAYIEYYDINMITFAIAIVLTCYIIGFVIVKLFNKLNQKIHLISFGCVLILSALIYFNNEHRILKSEITNPLITFYKSTISFKNENNDFLNKQKGFLDQITANNNIKNDTNTIVLILGESTQRNHMSLYGYDLKTTPLLEKRQNELIIFKDVISPDSHTIPVLKNIFSSRSSNDKKNWTNYPNLINVFNKAGYETFWVSNQEARSFWGNTALNISQLCNHQIFTETRENQKESKKHDEILLPFVSNIINKEKFPKKLIIIHLMGTHGIYADRYPEKFKKFTHKDIDKSNRKYLKKSQLDIIADYDNAVLYNDQIVNEIFSMIDESKSKTAGIYLSDHGEELYDFRPFSGHSSKNMSTYMLEIPFLIKTNELYSLMNQNKINQLRNSTNHPYLSENLPNLLYSMANIETNLYESSKDISNQDFIINRNRTIHGISYQKLLNNIKLVRENYFLDRLWVHRVNSIEKLKYIQYIKKNIEVDIIIEKDTNNSLQILVGHDKNDPNNFLFSDYVKVIKGNHNIKIWLDLKNINSTNFSDFISKFEDIIKQNKLNKNQFLMESVDINIAIKFQNKNYLSSYYIWVPEVEKLSEKEKETYLLSLFNKVKESKLTRISFDHSLINPAKAVFQEKLPNLKFLSWNTHKYFKKNMFYASQQLQDSVIDIFLIKYKTEFDR